MEKLGILIIDDLLEKSAEYTIKGYAGIEEKFPCIFSVSHAVNFDGRSFGNLSRKNAVQYLMEHQYDIILLDCLFQPGQATGLDIVQYLGQIKKDNRYGSLSVTIKENCYLIGVSRSWNSSPYFQRIVREHFQDCVLGTEPQQLFTALELYLAKSHPEFVKK